ncbi:hypothetical protein JTE90_024455 [Oedothorax gibbosus]|uniref:Uncharacterized protein n=1 Tax=Oedothorax gibbosus TaxID=931172 RepID=A0AAV6TKR7_9ARAC|nr:hypothetical protein JTE90_024455 [Oedothorax gibbosus]
MGSHERLASDALTGRLVHSHSASSAYKSAHWALSSCLVRPSVMQCGTSHPFKGNFGGNQLLDGSISLTPLDPDLTIDLHVRNRYGPSTRVSSGLVLSGHSSPSFGSQRVRSNSATSTSGTRRVSGAPAREGTGIPNAADLRRPVLSFRRRAYSRPIGLAHMLDSLVRVSRGVGLHFQATRLPRRSHRIEPSSYGPRTHFLGQQPRSRGLAAESVSGTLTPKRHNFPTPLRAGDSALGFSRFTRRY